QNRGQGLHSRRLRVSLPSGKAQANKKGETEISRSMTLLLKFTVPGCPVSKKRHQTATLKKCTRCQRQTLRRQCICGSYEFQFMTNIESTPRETVLYENLVAMAARDAMQKSSETGSLGGPTRAINAGEGCPDKRATTNMTSEYELPWMARSASS